MATLKMINGRAELVNERGELCALDGELIADARLNPEYPIGKLFEDFYETPLGEDFLNTYGLDTINPVTGKANDQVIVEVFDKLYAHDKRVVMSRIIDTVKCAIDSGELVRMPEEIDDEDLPQRDDAGRFADAQQLLRAEVKRLLADPTVPASALRERADKDRAFGQAFREEITPAPVATAARSTDADLIAFSKAWVQQPKVTLIDGYAVVGGKEYTAAELEAKLQACSAQKLIR